MNTAGMFENSKVQIGDMIRVAPRVSAEMKAGILWPQVIIQSGKEAQPVKVAWTKDTMPTIREFRNFVDRELDY